MEAYSVYDHLPIKAVIRHVVQALSDARLPVSNIIYCIVPRRYDEDHPEVVFRTENEIRHGVHAVDLESIPQDIVHENPAFLDASTRRSGPSMHMLRLGLGWWVREVCNWVFPV